MLHSFNAHIAQKYGVNSAVVLHCLCMWIEKNRANGRHFYDGHYWAYNSKKAFTEVFPYFTARQVDYAIQKLINEGIIMTGNYNKKVLDRTLWYTITEKGYSILQICEMDFTNLYDRCDNDAKCITKVKPLTNVPTYINTCIKENIKRNPKRFSKSKSAQVASSFETDEFFKRALARSCPFTKDEKENANGK